MSLVKWEPFRELEEMFGKFGHFPRLGREDFSMPEWSPKVDISETDKEYTVKAELPGVNKEDVKVNVEDGELTISGERKEEKEEKGKKFHRVERYHGSFMRSFTLPKNIDTAGIKASFKDGVLDLSLPKNAEAKPKPSEVKIE